jgi:methyltransferase
VNRVAPLALAFAAASMLFEWRISSRHERILRARGAIAPPDPSYGTMRWAYPGTFILMAVEGALWPPPSVQIVLAGVGLMLLAKSLKGWAIAALGFRWTYRVFVLPGAALVTNGPYAFVRHPNYVAVLGELASMALLAGARITGPLSVVFFGYLLRRRIAAEERALGLSREI